MRGKEAIDDMDILPIYKGLLVHDHWKTYFKFDFYHILCNAHRLRELAYTEESENQKWAKSMREYLKDINNELVEQGGLLNLEAQAKAKKDIARFFKKLTRRIPLLKKVEGKRGRTKQTKSRNLLDRFIKYEEEILSFMTKKRITNYKQPR